LHPETLDDIVTLVDERLGKNRATGLSSRNEKRLVEPRVLPLGPEPIMDSSVYLWGASSTEVARYPVGEQGGCRHDK
jgi:hypothetical protein